VILLYQLRFCYIVFVASLDFDI